MLNLLHQKQHAEIGLDDLKVVFRPQQQRPCKTTQNFEDVELHVLLDEDLSQTLKQLAEALKVEEGFISRPSYAIRQIEKEEKWVPYELKKTSKE